MAGGSYVGITQYLAAEQQPPHLAAITPAGRDQRPLPRRLRARRDPEPLLRRPVHRRPGRARARPGRTPTRRCCRRRSRRSSGQSPPGTIAFDYLARPDDDAFYRDRSPIYRRRQDPGAGARSSAAGTTASLRGAPEMYRRARAAGAASRRGSTWTRARTRAAGAPFAPLTEPARPARTSRAVIFEFLAKYLRGAPTPERPPVEYYLQGARRVRRRRPLAAGAARSSERYALGAGTLGTRGGRRRATRQLRDQPAAGLQHGLQQVRHRRRDARTCRLDQRLEGPHGLTFRTAPLDRPLDARRAAARCTSSPRRARPTPTGTPSSPTSRPTAASRSSPRARCAPRTARSTRPRAAPGARTTPTPTRSRSSRAASTTTTSRSGRPPTGSRPGHRLQLRLTSTDLPTHLPGTIRVDRDHPQDARIDLLPPAIEHRALRAAATSSRRSKARPRPPRAELRPARRGRGRATCVCAAAARRPCARR